MTGHEFLAWRESIGMTVRELAKATGFDRCHLYAIQRRGAKTIYPQTVSLRKLARVGFPVEQFGYAPPAAPLPLRENRLDELERNIAQLKTRGRIELLKLSRQLLARQVLA